MDFLSFTVRELFLLSMVLVLMVLLLVSILRIQNLSRVARRKTDNQCLSPIKKDKAQKEINL